MKYFQSLDWKGKIIFLGFIAVVILRYTALFPDPNAPRNLVGRQSNSHTIINERTGNLEVVPHFFYSENYSYRFIEVTMENLFIVGLVLLFRKIFKEGGGIQR